MKAHGYAVIHQGAIDVNSISTTRRGAIVNWLFVVPRIPVLVGHSDEDIEQMWEANNKEAEVIEVVVTGPRFVPAEIPPDL